LLALSLKARSAVRVPEVVGLNTIVVVQLADAGKLDPQVFWEMAKSWGSAPTKPMLLMEMALLLSFVSVVDFPPPVLPTATLYHESEVGDTAAWAPACTPGKNAKAESTPVASAMIGLLKVNMLNLEGICTEIWGEKEFIGRLDRAAGEDTRENYSSCEVHRTVYGHARSFVAKKPQWQ
jgi:hypothetical protein